MKPIFLHTMLLGVGLLVAACSSFEQRKQSIPEPLVVTNPGSGTQPGSSTAVTPPSSTTPGSGTTTPPGSGTSTNPGSGTTTNPGSSTSTNPGSGTSTNPGSGTTTPPVTPTPPTPPTPPAPPTPPPPPPPPTNLFLYNGKIRLGINLNAGGAITYLTEGFRGENMVNNFDLGRQLQTSLYSGPVPFTPNGQKPVPTWANLGWNPVQTGDYYNNPARVVSYNQIDSTRLYVKTIPLIWPLNNVVAECTMETWIELKNNTAHVRVKTVINRSDKTQYEARTQEVPCMYLNGPYFQKISYTGSQPYTNAAVTQLTNEELTACYATENWTALLDKAGRGIGLFVPSQYRFATAFFGKTGVGSEYDDNTAYATAAPLIQMDYNGVYDYEYDLIVGNITDIRQFVYAQPRPATLPDFRFGAAVDKISAGRSGWSFYNTQDTGQPIQNELNVQWGRDDSTKSSFDIKSPQVFYRAANFPTLYVQAAFTTPATQALFTWRRPEDIDFLPMPERQVAFPIIGDGQMRTYKIDLAGRPGWDGIIMQMKFDPASNIVPRSSERAQRIKVKSITATAP